MRICFKNLEECNVNIEYKDKQAFIIMPFEPKEIFGPVYLGIKKPFEELGWICLRADERIDIPETICRICKNIQESRLIVSDVTDKNPNVFLEIGLSFGLEKEVIFVAQDIKDLPFDVKTFHAFHYSLDDLSKLSNILRDYVEKLKPIRLRGPSISDEDLFNQQLGEL